MEPSKDEPITDEKLTGDDPSTFEIKPEETKEDPEKPGEESYGDYSYTGEYGDYEYSEEDYDYYEDAKANSTNSTDATVEDESGRDEGNSTGEYAEEDPQGSNETSEDKSTKDDGETTKESETTRKPIAPTKDDKPPADEKPTEVETYEYEEEEPPEPEPEPRSMDELIEEEVLAPTNAEDIIETAKPAKADWEEKADPRKMKSLFRQFKFNTMRQNRAAKRK